MPLISFIVPVYKVEDYLDQCVQSLLIQSGSDYEIILVDDGSPDRCPEICESYAREHENVKVIHQKNGGLSAARNAGIRIAQGDYLLFVDSDDYIDSGFLRAVSQKIAQRPVDVAFLDALQIYSDGEVTPLGYPYEQLDFSGEEAAGILEQLSRFSKYPSGAWNKLFSRKLIVDNLLFFSEGLLYEDIDFTIAVFQYARSFDYYPIPYYYYRKNRNGSITNTIGIKHVNDLFFIIKKWSSDATPLSKPQKAVNAIMAYEYCVLLGYLHRSGKAIPESLRNEIFHYRWLLRYGRTRRIAAIRLLSRFPGLRAATFLLGVYLKLRKL
ncbi:glycosyltransferase family 2 protein [Acetanaerobacterium elongatum]|uniref:Glycosyltransferase involved in cell wall bisynthesis n=1 Tax=Acetanaerobacterium elongatum TaxID=258515 RepID=A0A1G9Z3I1_9FIRM|nr:glycosyltransferase [Acetanaerobacterium elongatum]SDN15859.1 Glycosyltransferase involved in cell wall bisynthesis [Acetanaerobacterium elongatum]